MRCSWLLPRQGNCKSTVQMFSFSKPPLPDFFQNLCCWKEIPVIRNSCFCKVAHVWRQLCRFASFSVEQTLRDIFFMPEFGLLQLLSLFQITGRFLFCFSVRACTLSMCTTLVSMYVSRKQNNSLAVSIFGCRHLLTWFESVHCLSKHGQYEDWVLQVLQARIAFCGLVITLFRVWQDINQPWPRPTVNKPFQNEKMCVLFEPAIASYAVMQNTIEALTSKIELQVTSTWI